MKKLLTNVKIIEIFEVCVVRVKKMWYNMLMEITRNKIILGIIVLVIVVATAAIAMISTSGLLFTGSVGGLSDIQKNGIKEGEITNFGDVR